MCSADLGFWVFSLMFGMPSLPCCNSCCLTPWGAQSCSCVCTKTSRGCRVQRLAEAMKVEICCYRTQRPGERLGKLMHPCDVVHPGWYISLGLGTWRTKSSTLLRLCVSARPLQEKAVGRDAFPGQHPGLFEGTGENVSFKSVFHQHLKEHTEKANSV